MGLTQAAPRFWNEIAETQSLQTKWAQRVLPMSGEDQIAEEDKDYYALVNKGESKTVARAAVYLKPLLLEQSAISRYLEKTNGYWLRGALPELNSINEAVLLATEEFRLNQSQQRRLTKLLKEMIEKEQTSQPLNCIRMIPRTSHSQKKPSGKSDSLNYSVEYTLTEERFWPPALDEMMNRGLNEKKTSRQQEAEWREAQLRRMELVSRPNSQTPASSTSEGVRQKLLKRLLCSLKSLEARSTKPST